MKTIKSISVSALILLSSSAFAAGQYVAPTNGDYRVDEETFTIETQPVKSQDESYKLGLNKLAKFYSMSPVELSKVLNINWAANPKLTHINDGGYITVEKMKYLDGSIFYKSKLNFSYHVAEEEEYSDND